MNYEHPFPRVLGYWRVGDITKVDIMEFRVYLTPIKKDQKQKITTCNQPVGLGKTRILTHVTSHGYSLATNFSICGIKNYLLK